MGFEDSFDFNEEDYSDVFCNYDDTEKYTVQEYGSLSKGFLFGDDILTKPDGISNEGFRSFFKSVKIIRNNSSLTEISESSIGITKLGFDSLEPICIEIKPDPDPLYEYLQPLACYRPKDKAILMDIEKINQSADKFGCNPSDLRIICFFHELMHKLMDPELPPQTNLKDKHLFWTFREEALANHYTLRILESSGNPGLATTARRFIATQPHELGYSYALIMETEDWKEWKEEKKNWHAKPKDYMDAYINEARQALLKHGFTLKY